MHFPPLALKQLNFGAKIIIWKRIYYSWPILIVLVMIRIHSEMLSQWSLKIFEILMLSNWCLVTHVFVYSITVRQCSHVKTNLFLYSYVWMYENSKTTIFCYRNFQKITTYFSRSRYKYSWLGFSYCAVIFRLYII